MSAFKPARAVRTADGSVDPAFSIASDITSHAAAASAAWYGYWLADQPYVLVKLVRKSLAVPNTLSDVFSSGTHCVLPMTPSADLPRAEMKPGVGGATVAAKPYFGLTPSSELCLMAATASFRCAEMMITSGFVPLRAMRALETSVALALTLVFDVYASADGTTVMPLAWASDTPV